MSNTALLLNLVNLKSCSWCIPSIGFKCKQSALIHSETSQSKICSPSKLTAWRRSHWNQMRATTNMRRFPCVNISRVATSQTYCWKSTVNTESFSRDVASKSVHLTLLLFNLRCRPSLSPSPGVQESASWPFQPAPETRRALGGRGEAALRQNSSMGRFHSWREKRPRC